MMTRLAATLLASIALALPVRAQAVADSAKAAAGTSGGFGLFSFGGVPGLGYFDGSQAKPKSVPVGGDTMTAQGGSSLLSLVMRDFLTRPVYAADFGENCNGGADNRAAYTAAAAYAVAQGRGLEFGAGTCLVLSGQVPINGPLKDIGGKGYGVTNIQGRFNGPIFLWTVDGSMNNFRVHDMTLSSYFKDPSSSYSAYSSTTALDIRGDNKGTMSYGQFDHLRLQGFYAGLTFEKSLPSSSDVFGYEGNVNWMAFNDIVFQASTQDGQYGIWFKQGSGTGNTFTDLRTAINGAPGAPTNPVAIRYDGPANSVQGDQVVTGSHFGGAIAGVFGVATGTSYRTNFSITGSQLDAGVKNVADLPSDLPAFARFDFTGNNVGGGVVVSLPPMRNSIIDDQLVDERRAGTNGTGISASPSRQSTNLFSLTTGSTNSQFYGGTYCEVQVDGLIGGIASGVTKAWFGLAYGPGGFTSYALDRQFRSAATSSFFKINATITKGALTFSTAYTAANGGLINDAQIICRGGTYSVKRLL